LNRRCRFSPSSGLRTSPTGRQRKRLAYSIAVGSPGTSCSWAANRAACRASSRVRKGSENVPLASGPAAVVSYHLVDQLAHIGFLWNVPSLAFVGARILIDDRSMRRGGSPGFIPIRPKLDVRLPCRSTGRRSRSC
jgi:hypothetical protein